MKDLSGLRIKPGTLRSTLAIVSSDTASVRTEPLLGLWIVINLIYNGESGYQKQW